MLGYFVVSIVHRTRTWPWIHTVPSSDCGIWSTPWPLNLSTVIKSLAIFNACSRSCSLVKSDTILHSPCSKPPFPEAHAKQNTAFFLRRICKSPCPRLLLLSWCFTSTETIRPIRDGRRWGEEGDYSYTYRYTDTTRMTPALWWAAMRAILMFR